MQSMKALTAQEVIDIAKSVEEKGNKQKIVATLFSCCDEEGGSLQQVIVFHKEIK